MNENRAILGLMLQATCPYCGQLANYREISIGTITLCKNCNQKYTYPALPEPIINEMQPILYKKRKNDDIGVAIMTVVAAVVAIVTSCLLVFAIKDKP